ncbi:DUF2786 domain-containing protein [Pseudonocardia sp. GCM10023141]|uniref:DUF2786 domain-containing protein n=1 Tax=Pseudonocardia sp. GCM10023141 TaxID=3252653 RepID=UPI0036240288
MDRSDQKLEVIRKLLAKAERAATTNEADAYNAKASELMAKHGVDAAMLAAASGDTRDTIGSLRMKMTDPYSVEKAQLANAVTQAMGCRLVQHPGYGRGQISAVTVIGFESDLRRIEVTYTSLMLQATKSVVHQRPPEWSRESTTAFRRTYLAGFSSEVYRRLLAAERGAVERHDAAATREGPSAALVLADRRSLVQAAFDEQYGDLKPGRKRTLSGSGYQAGREAGRRADVGQARVTGNRRALERG